MRTGEGQREVAAVQIDRDSQPSLSLPRGRTTTRNDARAFAPADRALLVGELVPAGADGLNEALRCAAELELACGAAPHSVRLGGGQRHFFAAELLARELELAQHLPWSCAHVCASADELGIRVLVESLQGRTLTLEQRQRGAKPVGIGGPSGGLDRLTESPTDGATPPISLAPAVLDVDAIDRARRVRVSDAALDFARRRLYATASLLLLNLDELELLTGRGARSVAMMRDGARRVADFGGVQVLLTGGRGSGHAVDLFFDGRDCFEIGSDRREGIDASGCGQRLGLGICARLGRGHESIDAIDASKRALDTWLAGRQLSR